VQLELLIVLLGYFLLLLAASFFFSRKIKNLEDFFLASRDLPAILVYFSLTASWIGASSILVSVDEAYRRGISSIWVMGVPAVLTVVVFAVFLARPIRQLPIVSLPDLVEMRYGRHVRNFSSLLIVWYMILLAASQMVAAGNFLKLFLGTSYLSALLLATVIVLIYSVFGGLFSVVITDSLQFYLLTCGVICLLFFLSGTSSLKEISFIAAQVGKEGYFYLFADIKKDLLIVLSFTCAWIISPIVWQRIQAARSVQKAKKGLLAAAVTFIFLYSSIVIIGILLLPLFPSGSQAGPLLSAFISSRTGSFLAVFLFVAITAAVMSTMDTAINTGALSLTRDIYQKLCSRSREKNIVFVSRVSTLILALLAFLIATRMQSILKTLGLASEIMAEGFFIPGVAMFFLHKKRPAAGFLSLFLGGGYAIIGFLCEVEILPFNWPVWPYSVPLGLGLCLAGFIVGMVIDKLVAVKWEKKQKMES